MLQPNQFISVTYFVNLGGELLTRTEDIAVRGRNTLLSPAGMSSIEEAESEDLGEDLSITLAEVIKVVNQRPGGKAPRVDEICPEMLKALDMVGLS